MIIFVILISYCNAENNMNFSPSKFESSSPIFANHLIVNEEPKQNKREPLNSHNSVDTITNSGTMSIYSGHVFYNFYNINVDGEEANSEKGTSKLIERIQQAIQKLQSIETLQANTFT